MNVKTNFSDLQRAECRNMIAAHRAGDDPAYETSAAEARRLLDAQVADHLAGMTSTTTVDHHGPVRPVYAAAIAAYAAAKTADQRDRKFDELCLIRADELVIETGDPDPEANLFEIYDIDGQVVSILEESGLNLEVLV